MPGITGSHQRPRQRPPQILHLSPQEGTDAETSGLLPGERMQFCCLKPQVWPFVTAVVGESGTTTRQDVILSPFCGVDTVVLRLVTCPRPWDLRAAELSPGFGVGTLGAGPCRR